MRGGQEQWSVINLSGEKQNNERQQNNKGEHGIMASFSYPLECKPEPNIT